MQCTVVVKAAKKVDLLAFVKDDRKDIDCKSMVELKTSKVSKKPGDSVKHKVV